MRNLLVLAAAFGLAGVAHAQSTSTVTQTGGSNDASVTQTGLNEATVTQVAGATANLGHQAIQVQTNTGGLKNEASITQQQNGNTNGTYSGYARQDQSGSDNEAVIVQGNTGTSDGSNASSTQNQTGAGNYASSTGLRDNVSTSQTQTGDDNDAIIEGNQQNSVIVQAQTGSRNYASIMGIGETRSNQLTQRQVGDDNDAYVTATEGFDTILQEQTGTFNYASADVDGRAISITQIQDGDYNKSVVVSESTTQRTLSTVVRTEQYGGAMGMMNSAEVTQGTAAAPVIDNEATILQGSMSLDVFSNTASITQMSSGNTGTISQMGDGNSATVSQN